MDNARTSGLGIPRNFRVEWPAWQETVCFADRADALKYAKMWAIQDKALVLVWDFAAAMHIQRFDGRGDAGECDGCGDLSSTLQTVDGDNPDRVRDLCIICRIG